MVGARSRRVTLALRGHFRRCRTRWLSPPLTLRFTPPLLSCALLRAVAVRILAPSPRCLFAPPLQPAGVTARPLPLAHPAICHEPLPALGATTPRLHAAGVARRPSSALGLGRGVGTSSPGRGIAYDSPPGRAGYVPTPWRAPRRPGLLNNPRLRAARPRGSAPRWITILPSASAAVDHYPAVGWIRGRLPLKQLTPRPCGAPWSKLTKKAERAELPDHLRTVSQTTSAVVHTGGTAVDHVRLTRKRHQPRWRRSCITAGIRNL
ncbi:MAG: hypothetical protein RL033_4845, partial [Pseudomonadota bacterium]